jgi:hypothetical protein
METLSQPFLKFSTRQRQRPKGSVSHCGTATTQRGGTWCLIYYRTSVPFHHSIRASWQLGTAPACQINDPQAGVCCSIALPFTTENCFAHHWASFAGAHRLGRWQPQRRAAAGNGSSGMQAKEYRANATLVAGGKEATCRLPSPGQLFTQINTPRCELRRSGDRC